MTCFPTVKKFWGFCRVSISLLAVRFVNEDHGIALGSSSPCTSHLDIVRTSSGSSGCQAVVRHLFGKWLLKKLYDMFSLLICIYIYVCIHIFNICVCLSYFFGIPYKYIIFIIDIYIILYIHTSHMQCKTYVVRENIDLELI